MRRGGASRRDRVAHAFDMIGRGERGRVRGAHRLWHFEWPDLFGTLLARGIGGLHDGPRRGSTGTHDETGPLVRDVILLEPGIADRLLHGDVVPGGTSAHEAPHLAVEHLPPVELRRAVYLAAEAELGIVVRLDDARLRLAQRREHLLGTISDRGHDPHAGYDHAFHRVKILGNQRRLRSDTCGCGFARLEEANSQILGRIDGLAIGLQPAVTGAEGKFAPDYPLELDDIFELLHGGENHSGKLHLADAKSTAPSRSAQPAKEEAEQLPQRVEAKAAGHDRIAFEMAGEEPKVWLHVEFGDDAAMAVLAAFLFHLRDAVEHEHGRQRQLRVAGAKQFPTRARKQILVFELVPPLSHGTFRFLPTSTPVQIWWFPITVIRRNPQVLPSS